MADADFIIEPITEYPQAKIDFYTALALLLPEKTGIAANSSTLLPGMFLSYMGQELYEDLRTVTKDSLREKLDRALALRQDRAALEQAVARLRRIEQNNSDMMKKLLDGN